MGRDPKVGRGNIPMGREYFNKITLFFILDEPFFSRKCVEKKIISKFHCILSLCRTHILLHILIYIAELKFQFIPFLFTTT
jgi:hypothetical protein